MKRQSLHYTRRHDLNSQVLSLWPGPESHKSTHISTRNHTLARSLSPSFSLSIRRESQSLPPADYFHDTSFGPFPNFSHDRGALAGGRRGMSSSTRHRIVGVTSRTWGGRSSFPLTPWARPPLRTAVAGSPHDPSCRSSPPRTRTYDVASAVPLTYVPRSASPAPPTPAGL